MYISLIFSEFISGLLNSNKKCDRENPFLNYVKLIPEKRVLIMKLQKIMQIVETVKQTKSKENKRAYFILRIIHRIDENTLKNRHQFEYIKMRKAMKQIQLFLKNFDKF